MREIKFRVWDKERKQWLPNTGNPYIFPFEGRVAMKCAGESTGHIDNQDYSEFYVLMQYTGLKDKNGREIYEGDILADGHERHEVKWRDSDGCQECGLTCGWMGPKEHREVIGNIYEKPELLEGA